MERYRIELVRIGDEKDETLVVLEGSAELVGRMAGGLVAEAVGAERAATTVVMPADDGDYATGEPDGSRPRRKRRTKAEIAADEAAARANGAADAADVAAAVESAPAAVAEPAQVSVPVPAVAPVMAASTAPYDPFAAK